MRNTVTLLLALLALLLSLPASAQNREFEEDYDSPRAQDQGSFGIGLGGTFNYTSTTNEVVSGESVDNNILFLRVNPRVEYFFIDNVPLVLRAGLLTRSLDRGSGAATELDGIFTVGSGYHVPLNQRLSLVLEAEIGGYFGSSERTLDISGSTVNESTDTRGFAYGAGLAFAYMLGDSGQLRAGVAYTGLLGNESVSSLDESLSATTHAVGLNLGYMFFF